MGEVNALMLAALDQSTVTAAALIDRARQDYGTLIEAYDLPAELKDAFSRDGALGALMEAYVTLSGEALRGLPDAELDQIIRERRELLASGIRAFATGET